MVGLKRWMDGERSQQRLDRFSKRTGDAAEFKPSLHKQGFKRRNGTGGDMAYKADLDFLTSRGKDLPGL